MKGPIICLHLKHPWHFTVRTLSKSNRFRTRKLQNNNISPASILKFSRSKMIGFWQSSHSEMSRGVDFFTWSLSMTVRWRGFHDRVVWLWTWHIYITPSAKHHGATDKTDQGLQKHKCKETFPLWHVCSILFSNKEMLSLNNNWSTYHSIFQEVQHNLVTSKELHRSSQHCGVTIHRNLVAVFKDHLRSLLWEGSFAVLAFSDVDQGIWNCGLQLDLLSLSVTEYLFWFLKKVHELDRTAERHFFLQGKKWNKLQVRLGVMLGSRYTQNEEEKSDQMLTRKCLRQE